MTIVARCDVPIDLADRLGDYFLEAECLNWTLHQDRPDSPMWLIGYFETPDQVAPAFTAVQAAFPEDIRGPLEVTSIEDTEWQNAYKAFLRPWSEGHLHWIPEWMRSEYTPPPGAATLYFDAGMAFGTGAHETTRLMGRRLVDAVLQGPCQNLSVIDVGCGSGILALSARVLGFGTVCGFDLDAPSVHISRNNLAANHLPPDAVSFFESDIERGLQGRTADFILANIISDVLIIHAQSLIEALSPKGRLALSGILNRERNRTRLAFETAFARLRPQTRVLCDTRSDGEWCDLLFTLHP